MTERIYKVFNKLSMNFPDFKYYHATLLLWWLWFLPFCTHMNDAIDGSFLLWLTVSMLYLFQKWRSCLAYCRITLWMRWFLFTKSAGAHMSWKSTNLLLILMECITTIALFRYETIMASFWIMLALKLAVRAKEH